MRTKGLSASSLKTIALVTMVIDHLTAFVYAAYLSQQGISVADDTIYSLGRAVGRVSFLLFAFLIGEGVRHTHDIRKYLGRLLILAVISEALFDFADTNSWIDLSKQNVFFTLFLGAFCCYLIEEFNKNEKFNSLPLVILLILTVCAVAVMIKCDYGLFGVALIVLLYLAGRDKNKLLIYSLTALVIVKSVNQVVARPEYWYLFSENRSVYFNWILDCILTEFPAILALIPIFSYNGQKGWQLPKAFYYFFYPAHLLILGLIVKYCF